MAGIETFGPFDSQPWADQTQWYRFAAAWAPSGVIDTPAAAVGSGSLGLTFNGLTPTLAAGRAWVRGAGYELSGGSKTLPTIAANTNASLSRMDRIVLRRDLSGKTVGPVALQGTPSSSPAAPALTQVETGQWDIPLFSFLVPPSSGTVVTGIVDERPWVDAAQPRFRGSGTAFPVNPNVGDTYFHTTLKCGHVYVGGVTDGAAWRQTMVAQIAATSSMADYVASVVAAGLSFHYDFLAYEVGTRTLWAADSASTLVRVASPGFLGQATGGDSTAQGTLKTIVSKTVTIPDGLPSTRRIKVTGTSFLATPTGVGGILTVGSSSRTISQSFDGDISVVLYDSDLTPGSRTYNLQTQTTVAGQSITYRAPTIAVEIV